jgi:glycine betaine catabolism B
VPLAASLLLAALFVFLAGFNVWNMLSGRGKSARGSRLWTQAHRACGYAFIALFVIFVYCMALRLRGLNDELPARLIFHVGLALMLAPLLFVKVIVARYQKAARGLLTALGISIFAFAFTLVAINALSHYLRGASSEKVHVATMVTVVVAALFLALLGYWKGSGAGQAKSTGTPAGAPAARSEINRRTDAWQLTLARIETQTNDAKTLRFLLPPGDELRARPGQFLTFEWMIDGRPVTRSYSICSSPMQASSVDITPKRVENGCVSQFLNDRAKIGLTVKARGPYGKFYFDPDSHKRIVLIAGGSGVTPMMAILRYIDDLCIGIDVTLIYCVRTEHDVFFKDDIAAIRRRLEKFRSVLVLSQPGAEWTGWKGRLRREVLEREVEKPEESIFFLCGPPAFMELGRSLLKEMGVDSSRILQESFGGAVAGEVHSAAGNGPLEVRFSRSAVVYSLSPNDNLLESAERNGVLLPSGCRQGQCGTCATRLLNGKVEMATEEALTDEQRSQGFVLPCVSRPVTDLILDA